MYKEYVCPKCFRQLNKCTCKYKPWSLVNIDLNIQEHIRILNEKGYMTKYCCECHFGDVSIYIKFCRNYDFKDLPKGFKYVKSSEAIYSEPLMKYTDINSFNVAKFKLLSDLLKYINSLPCLK